ncbi:hypothetical protein V6N13_026796 [Hibiscus sabdariffa]|uniref:Reverse transcriptase zinc-binding domain-containing protein n=1 Tax=Hibiscus sabdariffa TaxID=183260 RepID=A0ABR2N7U1_9ROSI
MCESCTESHQHAVRECPSVQEVYKESGLDVLLPQGPFRSSLEWLECVSNLIDKGQFTFLMVLAWNTWNRRNRWVHSNQLIPARLVFDYAQIVLTGFQEASEIACERVVRASSKVWEKPATGQAHKGHTLLHFAKSCGFVRQSYYVRPVVLWHLNHSSWLFSGIRTLPAIAESSSDSDTLI